MKTKLSLLALTIALFSCEPKNEEPYPPSIIEFELQHFGVSPGGIFLENQILERKTYAFLADGENSVSGGILTEPDDDKYLIIAGNGNNCHPYIKYFSLSVPDRGEGNYVGSYHFDPDTSTQKEFNINIKTTNDGELQGASNGYGGIDTKFSVTITEFTDECIKGSFSGDLVYYQVETLSSGTRNLILDEEISFVNKPIVNGTFEVYISN